MGRPVPPTAHLDTPFGLARHEAALEVVRACKEAASAASNPKGGLRLWMPHSALSFARDDTWRPC